VACILRRTGQNDSGALKQAGGKPASSIGSKFSLQALESPDAKEKGLLATCNILETGYNILAEADSPTLPSDELMDRP
jgi:hypothetical protein